MADSANGSSSESTHLFLSRNNSQLSSSSLLDTLLKKVASSVIEVKDFVEDQIKHIKQRTRIGMALSAEKDINRLLEMIVDEAREFTHADAGTLYVLDDNDHLIFKILHNETMNTRMGGKDEPAPNLPSVPLFINGKPNFSNVSSYTALTGKVMNFPDVYEANGFAFRGAKDYDLASGYRSKSMLVLPMKNHEDRIIGVLQLINAKDPNTGKVIPFSAEFTDLVASLASQAAITLTNAQLIQDMENLFYAFIKAIATAIDEKSPYTGGHIDRVVKLTMLIAENMNSAEEGPFKDIHFTQDELEELRIAAWMHDVGKITTPEYVVDKSSKLETIFDRIGLIETRYQLIAEQAKTQALQKKIDLMRAAGSDTEAKIVQLEYDLKKELAAIDEELAFIRSCNNTGEFMSDDKLGRIKAISHKRYTVLGQEYPYLTQNEVENLTIRKGTLTDAERKIIENHVQMTLKITNQLPFPRKLARVPEFASSHHEKLDGSGYSWGLKGDRLSLQTRILTIADIFEALTAKDRPYKKPMKLSMAVKILGTLKEQNHIDADIYDFFINTELYRQYADHELNPEQID